MLQLFTKPVNDLRLFSKSHVKIRVGINIKDDVIRYAVVFDNPTRPRVPRREKASLIKVDYLFPFVLQPQLIIGEVSLCEWLNNIPLIRSFLPIDEIRDTSDLEFRRSLASPFVAPAAKTPKIGRTIVHLSSRSLANFDFTNVGVEVAIESHVSLSDSIASRVLSDEQLPILVFDSLETDLSFEELADIRQFSDFSSRCNELRGEERLTKHLYLYSSRFRNILDFPWFSDFRINYLEKESVTGVTKVLVNVACDLVDLRFEELIDPFFDRTETTLLDLSHLMMRVTCFSNWSKTIPGKVCVKVPLLRRSQIPYKDLTFYFSALYFKGVVSASKLLLCPMKVKVKTNDGKKRLGFDPPSFKTSPLFRVPFPKKTSCHAKSFERFLCYDLKSFEFFRENLIIATKSVVANISKLVERNQSSSSRNLEHNIAREQNFALKKSSGVLPPTCLIDSGPNISKVVDEYLSRKLFPTSQLAEAKKSCRSNELLMIIVSESFYEGYAHVVAGLSAQFSVHCIDYKIDDGADVIVDPGIGIYVFNEAEVIDRGTLKLKLQNLIKTSLKYCRLWIIVLRTRLLARHFNEHLLLLSQSIAKFRSKICIRVIVKNDYSLLTTISTVCSLVCGEVSRLFLKPEAYHQRTFLGRSDPKREAQICVLQKLPSINLFLAAAILSKLPFQDVFLGEGELLKNSVQKYCLYAAEMEEIWDMLQIANNQYL